MKHPPLFVRLLLALSIGAIAALGACAQEGQVSSLPSSSGVPTADYVIGPGDTLQVFVFGHPDLSVTVQVRPDGRVTTPLIEDIECVGKTSSQLARDMEKVLSEFVRTPQVNVIVQQAIGTFANQIRVLGQVTKPGAVPYREPMTLLDVIIEAGGLTKFAAGNKAKLVRTVDGRSQVTRVRLADLVNRGKLDKNVVMRPGDVVIVPEAIF